MTTTTTAATPDQALASTQSIEQVQGQLAAIDKIEAGFAVLAKEHPKDLAIDVTTVKGMREAVAARAAWRDPRIATEKARKAAKAPVLELGRAIDARAAELTTRLLEGESNYDDQIKAEEARKEREREMKAQAEARRIETIQYAISGLRVTPSPLASSDEITVAIAAMVEQPITREGFAEFVEQAENAKAATLVTLRQMHAAAVEREAEAARLAAEREELAQLRAAQEERERVERERVAAEQAAEGERLAAQRRELEEQQRAILAEQQRLDAEAAEKRRVADAEAAAARQAADEQARLEREEQLRQLEAERGEVRRQQAEQLQQAQAAERERAAAERQRADAEHARLVAENAARERLHRAAPVLLDALRQWQHAEATNDAAELANARHARDEAITEATVDELEDIAF
jgi:colicin import membrane protein